MFTNVLTVFVSLVTAAWNDNDLLEIWCDSFVDISFIYRILYQRASGTDRITSDSIKISMSLVKLYLH